MWDHWERKAHSKKWHHYGLREKTESCVIVRRWGCGGHTLKVNVPWRQLCEDLTCPDRVQVIRPRARLDFLTTTGTQLRVTRIREAQLHQPSEFGKGAAVSWTARQFRCMERLTKTAGHLSYYRGLCWMDHRIIKEHTHTGIDYLLPCYLKRCLHSVFP